MYTEAALNEAVEGTVVTVAPRVKYTRTGRRGVWLKNGSRHGFKSSAEIAAMLTPALTPAEQAQAALTAVLQSKELEALFIQLREAQAATETDGTWETALGRRTEAAWGGLQSALEAAGYRL